MDVDRAVTADEYFVTAVQIFDYCGVDKTSTVSVSTLMDKFAPFTKTNKSEYTFLRSLLDPEQTDPEITVSKLASTLNYYSENQKVKLDLDESFNLKGGQVPQDSDSGISSDGFQILEELQCELREKTHLAHSLRTQLELTSHHHEEALGALTAERDTLRVQLNVMREENASLSADRVDYEEACERLTAAEQALADARQELGAVRRRASRATEQLAVMEAEKLTLQELLAQSKQECHRINEMYASRQSVLLEENEALKTDHADLSTRLQDQEEFMQQIIKEKVILEMELKDVLNKSNHIHSRMDRSIDVSYTDDQMLTALDSLNADSKFIQDCRGSILDEESFLNALHEDSGRPTNMSLYDEIRLSFYNKSKLDLSEFNCMDYFEKRYSHLDSTFDTVATQTDKESNIGRDIYLNRKDNIKNNVEIQQNVALQTQVEGEKNDRTNDENIKVVKHDKINQYDIEIKSVSIQTDEMINEKKDLSSVSTEINIPASKVECKNVATNSTMYEVTKGIKNINFGVQTAIPKCIENKLENCKEYTEYNLKKHATILENYSKNTGRDCNKRIKCNEKNITMETMLHNYNRNDAKVVINKTKDLTCATTELNIPSTIIESKDVATNTNTMYELFNDVEVMNHGVQTTEPYFNETRAENCNECYKLQKHATNLENDLKNTENDYKNKIKRYEKNISLMRIMLDESNTRNEFMKSLVDNLKSKINILENAYVEQNRHIDDLNSKSTCEVDSDVVSVGTQAEIPCAECVKYTAPTRSIKKFFWDSIKCLFQLFAVVCFACAVCVLYGVRRAPCRELPARWLRPADLLDLLLRVEYVADVPM